MSENDDKKVRQELAALNKVIRALLTLPDEERQRVMRYLLDRYGAGGTR